MTQYGTSALYYRRKLDASSMVAKRPLDALSAYSMVNNGLHLADESAQVIVAWTATSAEGPGYLTGDTTYASNATIPITMFRVFLRRRENDGRSYSVRIRIAGASADGVSTARFFAVLAPPTATQAAAEIAAGGDHVFKTATTVSAVGAWLTGTSQGPSAWTTKIQVDQRNAASWLAGQTTLTDLGGAPASVQVLDLALGIFGTTTNGAQPPRLYGVYAAEYVGG